MTAKTYLSPLVAITIHDPYFEHWLTTDHVPHEIEWAVAKRPSHDCHYAIYYRRPAPPGHSASSWRLYGHFERDCPR